MITVITNENAVEYNANAYPGMSLAEACNQLQVNTLNAIHEFQMNLLLAEHAYLYENGHEISYVNEAGELNDKGKNVKDAIIGTITSIGNWINETFDKLIGWVLQRVEDVQEFFAKKGLTKGIAKKGIDIYTNLCGKNDFAKAKVNQQKVDRDKFEEFIFSSKDDLYSNDKFDINRYIAKDASEEEVNGSMASLAYNEVYETKHHVIAEIYKAKNEANRVIKDIIKDIKASKNIDDNINEYKDLAKANSDKCREAIKVYHTYMFNQIGILRAVVLHPEVKKQIHSDAKDSFKPKPNKKEKAPEKKEEAPAAEEANNESTIYNGKFFRV